MELKVKRNKPERRPAEGGSGRSWKMQSPRQQAKSPPRSLSRNVPLPQTYGIRASQSMRRGEYRNFTFRLPTHAPEVHLSVTVDYGSVCLYASNCSERPQPRMCTWTMLVDASKERFGTLPVRTDEQHFVSGLYHVGLYCVADASFSLGCFATRPTVHDALLAAQQERRRANACSPRSLEPQRASHKPFVDAGLLEQALSVRAQLHNARAAALPQYLDEKVESPRAPAAAPIWQPPGDRHYENVCGKWHRELRDRTSPRGFSPREATNGQGVTTPSPREYHASNGLMPPPQSEALSPRIAFYPAPYVNAFEPLATYSYCHGASRYSHGL